MLLWSSRNKSIFINAVILAALLLCVHTVYETNDDHTIARMIAGEYANVGFVNYYLCRFLIAIQRNLTGINVFVLFQILLSYVAFVVILRIILDRSKSRFINIIAIAVIAVFSIDHYLTIQFTKTSALLITVGLVSIVDIAQFNKKNIHYIEGVLLIVIGTTFRWNTLLPSVGYLCAYVAVFILIQIIAKLKKEHTAENSVSIKSIVSCVVVLVIAVGISFGIDKASSIENRSTEQLKTFREYSSLRARITDFPVDDLYENYTEECDAIGIDANDIFLIHKWVFDYDGAASIENLRILSKMGKEVSGKRLTISQVVKKCGKDIIKSLKKLDYTGWHIIILVLLSLFVILTTKPRNWFYVAAFGLLTLCLYLVLYYMQRPVYRTLYIADIGAAMWLLYTIANNSHVTKGLSKAMATILIIACLAAIPMEAQRVERRYNSITKRTRSVELDNYFEKHSDSLFVCEVNGWNNASTYAEPFKVSTNKYSNDISIGGWATLSPYLMEHLKHYGIINPVRDLINNEKAYYVGNARMKEMQQYYNKWYSNGKKDIKFELIDTIGNKNIWKIEKYR